jgi:hypothetical protein
LLRFSSLKQYRKPQYVSDKHEEEEEDISESDANGMSDDDSEKDSDDDSVDTPLVNSQALASDMFTEMIRDINPQSTVLAGLLEDGMPVVGKAQTLQSDSGAKDLSPKDVMDDSDDDDYPGLWF